VSCSIFGPRQLEMLMRSSLPWLRPQLRCDVASDCYLKRRGLTGGATVSVTPQLCTGSNVDQFGFNIDSISVFNDLPDQHGVHTQVAPNTLGIILPSLVVRDGATGHLSRSERPSLTIFQHGVLPFSQNLRRRLLTLNLDQFERAE
jgi:hypothetical protein